MTSQTEPDARRGRDALWWLRALAPAAVYLSVRLTGVLVLTVMAAADGSTLGRELSAWDGQWLLAIAGDGYARVPPDMVDAFGARTAFTPLAFFPGYPGTVAAVGLLTGLDLLVAALLVSLLAGMVAAYGMARLGELVPGGSDRVGLVLVALFAATPMSVVLSMAYSEALFCALAAWALVGALRGQWLLAGLCSAAAGLVRPTATAVIAAVGLAALAAVFARRDGWRPVAGGLLAGAGMLGYLTFVAVRTGEPLGWFRIQDGGWGTAFDGGADTIAYAGAVLVDGERLYEVAVLAALLASLVLFVVAVRMRLPWPLLVYGATVLVTVWGSAGVMPSKVRLLVPAFVLLIPVAIGLGRRRTGTAVAVLAAVALGSAWFGGYALTIWVYGI